MTEFFIKHTKIYKKNPLLYILVQLLDTIQLGYIIYNIVIDGDILLSIAYYILLSYILYPIHKYLNQ